MNDFNIQAASIMSGVSVHQIRAWEKRYHAVCPRRLGNNFRSYTQDNIMRLKLLGNLTRQGIAISKIAFLETEELKQQFESLENNEAPRIESEVFVETNEKLDLLLNFLTAKRFDIVRHEILKLHSLSSVTGILIPMMRFLMNDPAFSQVQESKSLLSLLIEETNRISTHVQHRNEMNHISKKVS
jgi:DNA-binding transcriptional MerR regulator